MPTHRSGHSLVLSNFNASAFLFFCFFPFLLQNLLLFYYCVYFLVTCSLSLYLIFSNPKLLLILFELLMLCYSKTLVLLNAIYRFKVIPIKLPMAFSPELEQKISQLMQKHKRLWIAKAIVRKKNEAGGINLTDFRLYYKATVIKTVW